MAAKILITGGVRSGKSRYALARALAVPAPRVFVATADRADGSMRERIQKHQADRGNKFQLIEETLDLPAAFVNLKAKPSVIVIDCLTLWMGNLLQTFRQDPARIQKLTENLETCVRESETDFILVTNEVGSGVIPSNALARDFLDELGQLNQKFANACTEVILMVSGIPQTLKAPHSYEPMDRTLKAHSTD